MSLSFYVFTSIYAGLIGLCWRRLDHGQWSWSPELISLFLAKLSAAFKIRDLGTPSFFFGIQTVQTTDGLLLSHRRYMGDILKRVGMVDYKRLATPVPVSRPIVASSEPFNDPTHYRSLVGALQYLTVTWPDLFYAVNQLCQHMHSLTLEHWS